MQKAEGQHFNDWPIDSPVRRTAAKAILTLELGEMLKGEPVDSDRHGGQMRVSESSDGAIIVGVFDFAEMMTASPTESDILPLSEAMPYIIADAFRSAEINLPGFEHYTDQLRAQQQSLNPYVTTCYRALLALQDTMQSLNPKDLQEVLGALIHYDGLNKTLRESFQHTLISVGEQMSASNQPVAWLGSYQLTRIAQGHVSSAIQVIKSYTYSEPDSPYNSYTWDHIAEIEGYTKQPIYKFRAYKDGILVGTASFFGTRSYCHGFDDARTNILESTGVITELLSTTPPEQICAVMPLTYSEAIIYEVKQGSNLGVSRGLGRVTEWQMHGHVSSAAAWFIGKSVQYSTIFAWSYYQKVNEQVGLDVGWMPLLQATVETGSLMAVDATLGLSSQLLGWLSTKAASVEDSKIAAVTAATTGFFSRHLDKGVFVYQATQKNILAIGANMAGGIVTEQAVISVAKLCGVKQPSMQPK